MKKIFQPEYSGNQFTYHIYPENLLDFMNGINQAYYIIEGTKVMYMDMGAHTYEEYDAIEADDWHCASIDCFDPATFQLMYCKSPTKLYDIQAKATATESNPDALYYYNNDKYVFS